MKIKTIACTLGCQLPEDFGMFGARLRQIDVPVSSDRHGWGADLVRNAGAVVIAVKPTPVVQKAPVPLSRLRVRTLT